MKDSIREARKFWEESYKTAEEVGDTVEYIFPYERFKSVKKFLDSSFDYLKKELKGEKINVLEVGSGKGAYLLKRAHKVLEEGPAYLASDIVRPNKLPFPAEILQGTVTDLPLEDESISLLLCGFVLTYADKKRAISEMKRVLKDVGISLLLLHSKKNPLLPTKEGAKKLIEDSKTETREKEAKKMKYRGEVSKKVRESGFESLKEVEKFFERENFEIIESRKFEPKGKVEGVFPYPVLRRYRDGYDTLGFGLLIKK